MSDNALPPSYKHIPDNMLVAGKIKDLKFSEVRVKILEAEALRKGDMTTSANLLMSNKPKNGKKCDRSGPPPSPCKYCQGNHWNDQCKKKPKSSLSEPLYSSAPNVL